jgi:DnaK suppressor protein
MDRAARLEGKGKRMDARSTERLADICQRLQRRREQLSDELATSRQDLVAATTSEADEGTLSTHQADEASDLLTAETSLGDSRTLEAELAEIDAALKRIEQGTYGRCVECGELIDPARLAALPTAARCLRCETRYEQAVEGETS